MVMFLADLTLLKGVLLMNKIFSVFVCFVFLLGSISVVSSAEDYSTVYPVLPEPVMPIEDYDTEYPNIFNSGSPLWIHCQIEGMGDYVIVIDPNTNPQSFGFDSPNGYGLINNTGSTIVGRAYSTRSSTGYNARWLSFYKLQLQTGTSAGGQKVYEDYDILQIYGTTLDLIDYNGTRSNDLYKYDLEEREYNVIVVSVVCVLLFLFVLFLLAKPRLLRG